MPEFTKEITFKEC